MVASSIVNGLDPLTQPLTLFIIQLLLIVIISRVLTYLLSYIQQPPVISEVITGILLGPSVFGLSKAFTAHVFPPTSIPILNVFANVGLIFFMFMIGLEVDPTILRNNIKSSMIISLSSIILPFAMGIGLAAALYHSLVPDSSDISFGLFCVFVGVAISITAFPVLARILTERNLMTSKVGITALAAASVDDVIAWILLAFVVSFAKNLKTGDTDVRTKLAALWTFILLFGFVLFMGFPVRLGLKYITKRFIKTESHKHNFIVFLIMLMFMSAFYTEVIGVHAIFGAFILGVIVPREKGIHHTIIERIQDLVTIVLLPLYFTYSGLRTKLNSINSGTAGGLTILIIVVACIGKIGGATLASRFTKNSWRESITVGFLMNTKGLVELIVLNIGLDIGVLDVQLFTMFVVMALVTTFMTTPVVYFIWTRWEDKMGRQPMKPREKGKFNILLYPTQSRIGVAMTMIGASIVSPTNGNKKYKLSSIYATEVSGDRPSTYFFNSVKNLPAARRDVYDSINEESKAIGVKVKPVIMNSTDISADICQVAKNQWPDLVLMGFTREKHEQPLSVSMDHFGGESPFYGKVIVKVLENVRSAVGIVVDKGLERFNKQHRILFVYTGQDYENDALVLVCKMARRTNIKVTVVTNQTQQVLDKINGNKKLDVNRFELVQHSDPHQDLFIRSRDEHADYWMIVVGIQREDSIKQEKLINGSLFSLLILHPSNTLLQIQKDEFGALKMSHSNLHMNEQALELPEINNNNNNLNNDITNISSSNNGEYIHQNDDGGREH